MDNSAAIKRQLEKIGNTVYLKDEDWISMPFKAAVSHLWRRKNSTFEPKITPLGIATDEYYLYIGPSNHNITALSDNATLLFDDCEFEFRCRDAVCIADKVAYYTGILRKVSGGDEDEA